MIAARVLDALAEAIDAGQDASSAGASLGRVDPALRARARRRLRAACADAAIAMGAPRAREGDPVRPTGAERERHLLQVAYLLVARWPAPVAWADAAAVADAFARARVGARAPSRVWWITLLAAGTLVAGAAFAAREVLDDSGPRASVPARLGPAPQGAFAEGGAPRAEPAVRRALAKELPSYIMAIDRSARARRDGAGVAEAERDVVAARARVLEPEATSALGPAATVALDVVLHRARAAAEAQPADGAAAARALATAIGAFDDELAATGLGYFIDGDVLESEGGSERTVIIYSFAVEQVRHHTSGTDVVAALHLKRIDDLNWRHTLLGFTRPDLRWALVLLDQVDDLLVSYVLPGLGPDAAVDLSDAQTAAPEDRAVRARTGELVRAEYGKAPGLDHAAAARAGELFAKRHALFERWRVELEPRGITVAEPSALGFGPEQEAQLTGFVAASDLQTLRGIDTALSEAAPLAAYARLRALLVGSIERHEVQHRLDFARGAERPVPEALARYVGRAEEGGRARPRATLARDECSAYLAELARDELTGRVSLALLTRFLLQRRLWGTAESYAALTIVEGLSRGLGIPLPERGLLHDREIDVAGVSAVYLALTARPAGELRGAAGRLYAELFGRPLEPLSPRD